MAWWQRALVAVVAMAAVTALVVLFTTGGDGGDDPGAFANPVVRVVPERDTLAVRQARIGVVLRQGYEAELFIDGRPIPKDQLTVNLPLGEFFYQPAEGLEFERFEEGRHCVTATIVNRVDPTDDVPDVTWCFRVA